MDKSFWEDRWQRGDTAFHQPHIHDQLKRLWQATGVAAGATVFVPLCGKSRDMVWLAEQGHQIIGAELSKVAVRDFFDELALEPEKTTRGKFESFRSGPFTLLCGDVFELTADDIGDAGAVYDRAALVAFPPDMQSAYVQRLTAILPAASSIFLASLDYPKGEITGPPFATPRETVEKLFSDNYSIELLEARDGLAASENLRQRGVTRLEETAYLLRRTA